MQNVTTHETPDRTDGAAPLSRRTTAWVGAAILTVLVVLGLVSGGTASVTSGRALVIGDSLTHDSEAAVGQALQAAGWDPVVDGRGGWTVGLWQAEVVNVADFVRPDVAVVALGTNDCDKQCAPLGPGIDAIVTSLLDAGAEKIYWLNVQEFPYYPTHATYVNDEIGRAVVKWPQVQLVDLDGLMEGHPEWHIEDNLHFNDTGSQQFADLIVRALAS